MKLVHFIVVGRHGRGGRICTRYTYINKNMLWSFKLYFCDISKSYIAFAEQTVFGLQSLYVKLSIEMEFM